ncbi:MAG TPA: hypothetical protein VFM17_03800, partial [Candidatus Eisenbacteria bacterium]|nr:hypothetical protein [Candidatus Eisenbacteria bacterium]
MPILRSRDSSVPLPVRILAASLLLATVSAAPVGAQFIYFDANGDGLSTQADLLAPSGSSALDVWLSTDTNRDGSPASCSSADGPLSISGYEFIVRAANGTVSWDGFVNQRPEFSSATGTAFGTTDFRTGYAGASLPAGTYRLGTLTVTPISGTPVLAFMPSSGLDASYLTAFVSACSGADLDNTLKMGVDWFDNDVLPYGGTANTAPAFAPPATIEMDEGTTRVEPLVATDGEGNPVEF